ncbi:MAG: septum formation initiator family protein [Firmicutes bacterium]|nr:septum formation initiator family protein [Bacillota bacterium]
MPPVSRGSSAYKLQPAPKPQKKSVPRKNNKVKKRTKTIKFKIIAFVICAFLVQLFLCYRWVAIYDLHSEIERLNSNLASLQRENEQTAVAVDSLVDSSKVEEYAINHLGMQKMDSNQIVYIRQTHGDSMQKVARNNYRSSKRNIFGALSSSVGGLLEYFK